MTCELLGLSGFFPAKLPPRHMSGLGAGPNTAPCIRDTRALADKIRRRDALQRQLTRQEALLAKCQLKRGPEAVRCVRIETKKIDPIQQKIEGLLTLFPALEAAKAASCNVAPLPAPIPTCPVNQVYDPVLNACKYKPVGQPQLPTCPPGQRYDAPTHTCRYITAPPSQPMPLSCEPGYFYSDAYRACVPLPVAPIPNPGTTPVYPPTYFDPGYYGYPQSSAPSTPQLLPSFDYESPPSAQPGFQEETFPDATQVGQQAPVMSAAVAQAAISECDPGFSVRLPLAYEDDYGPMQVLQVVCSAPSNMNTPAGVASPQSPIEDSELATLRGFSLGEIGRHLG